jgi:hypothetical protein
MGQVSGISFVPREKVSLSAAYFNMNRAVFARGKSLN